MCCLIDRTAGICSGGRLTCLTFHASMRIYMRMPEVTATARRRYVIGELLRSSSIATQEALAEALVSRGFSVTQSTLSRDLRSLGVVKSPEGYALPGGAGEMSSEAGSRESLVRVLRANLIESTPAGTLVVLRTAPGHAQPVGLALDAARLDGAVGNVAGDDTIFVATPSERDARRLAESFREMGGLPSAPGLMGAA